MASLLSLHTLISTDFGQYIQWNFPLQRCRMFRRVVTHTRALIGFPFVAKQRYILLTIRITPKHSLIYVFRSKYNVQMFPINNDMVIGKRVLQVDI